MIDHFSYKISNYSNRIIVGKSFNKIEVDKYVKNYVSINCVDRAEMKKNELANYLKQNGKKSIIFSDSTSDLSSFPSNETLFIGDFSNSDKIEFVDNILHHRNLSLFYDSPLIYIADFFSERKLAKYFLEHKINNTSQSKEELMTLCRSLSNNEVNLDYIIKKIRENDYFTSSFVDEFEQYNFIIINKLERFRYIERLLIYSLLSDNKLNSRIYEYNLGYYSIENVFISYFTNKFDFMSIHW